MRKWLLVMGLWALAARTAPADAITDFAVFGGTGVTVGGSSAVVGGLTGSNQTVTSNAFVTYAGLAGGQLQMTSPSATMTVNGPLTFGGNIAANVSTITGPINGGGNVALGFAFGQTRGITARGSVSVGPVYTVNGNILAGGPVTLGSFTTVTGTVTPNAPNVTPVPFTPVALPGADVFSPGTTPVNVPGGFGPPTAIAPGAYGNLNVATFGKVTLRSGDYFFNNVTFGGSTELHLDLSSGAPLNVFVAGAFTRGAFSNVFVRGPTGPEVPMTGADPSLASLVFLETLGTFTDTAGDQFFGTIFAPNAPVALGQSERIIGSVVSGRTVTTGAFFNLSFVGANRFRQLSTPSVPEPSALALWGLGGLAISIRLRRAGPVKRLLNRSRPRSCSEPAPREMA